MVGGSARLPALSTSLPISLTKSLSAERSGQNTRFAAQSFAPSDNQPSELAFQLVSNTDRQQEASTRLLSVHNTLLGY